MGIETLLDLDGERFEVGNGYWVKFDAKQVDVTKMIPHGVKYSLTLHRPDNTRIMGFDNAHLVKPPGNQFKYAVQFFAYQKPPVPYHFNSPEKLVEDFWDAVDHALLQEGV